MRRLAAPLVLAFAILALPVASASATFHEQMANEAMLKSSTGDEAVQFVELYDAGGLEESFPPINSYGLQVYDAAGSKVAGGFQALSASGMAAAAKDNRPYLISTAAADTALKVTGDEPLTVTLPQSAGQACYTANGKPYSCITWGCITHVVAAIGAGSFSGSAAPDAGQSVQRQPDNSVDIADPTPGEPNKAGTSKQVCTGGSGGGGSGAGSGSFGGVRVGGGKVKVRHGKAPVAVTCPAKAKGSCAGSLVLRSRKTHKKLGRASFSIGHGTKKTVRVKLSRGARKRLGKTGTLKAAATATAHDGSGRSRVTHANVTLKGKKRRHP